MMHRSRHKSELQRIAFQEYNPLRGMLVTEQSQSEGDS